jgi:hypothetical protein
MHRHSMLAIAAMAACAALAWAGAASARRLELPANERGFRLAWSVLEFTSAAGTVRCPVTLEGSYHSRTISKVVGSLIGFVTRASIAACTGGTNRLLSETLPWHVRYRGFVGSLPAIDSVAHSIVGMAFNMTVGGLGCLVTTTATNPAQVVSTLVEAEEGEPVEGGLVFSTARASEEVVIPLRGGFLCEIGGSGSLRGTANVTQLGSLRKVNVALTELAAPQLVLRRAAGPILPEEIVVTITNNAPKGGKWMEVAEVKKGGANPANYTLNDPVPCRTKLMAPQKLCAVQVIRNVGGGATEIEVSLSNGTEAKINVA